MQRELGEIRRTVEKYRMISKNACVAVGVSGGKDSLALLYLLSELRRIIPFTLKAVFLKLSPLADPGPIERLCDSLSVPLTVIGTDFASTLLDAPHPCAKCAYLRRGMLVKAAKEAGCDLLALGHHREDAEETLLMNILEGGRMETLHPVAVMEREGLRVIRPAIRLSEESLRAIAEREHLPVMKSLCPYDGKSRRADMKRILTALEKECPGAKEQLLAAVAKKLWDGEKETDKETDKETE